MKLYKRSNYFSCGARVQGEEANLADLKAALAEYGEVSVPHKAILWLNINSTPEVNEAFNDMIKSSEEVYD